MKNVKNIRIRFTGDKKQRRYTNGIITCRLEYPETCRIEVSKERADQLLTDFPTWFVLDHSDEQLEFLRKIKIIYENPKSKLLTKDQINDNAVRYFPDIDVNTSMLKKNMAEVILNE